MNGEIKKHIDAARQVLVGVVPNPSSQIDQITYALIYKFMDDMDQAAIKSGDKPSFFVDDLEEYSWARLMDSKLGNQEKMNLYVLAFQKFAEAKQLPELFRNILKSAFLPYRSPETLGLFLKEINYFDYSHPEELGNAYEYLLSIMSSQGDAGQFRTPRHIIDFIVNVVNPTKNDKILDPACGTGGFLISSYKHILEQHDGKDDPEGKEKPLTPDERRKLMSNLEGYDIDPGMVRIAQVNMYLHQFKDPKIFQYDTLSSEERWNDKFDVILANPPFMSPKGGITPHNKFSVQSTRSEVLFVDYIMNHLRPKGRAGIIVPEGIIFQSGRAYKELRKNLVNDGLCAVVSLPSGVFNPYAGVKTSILFFDNEIAKKTKEILFIKINQDGFNLGAQRRPIEQNDLPEALEILKKWEKGKKVESSLALYVEKFKISENNGYNLSGDFYRVATDYTSAKWPMVKLEEVAEIINGYAFKSEKYINKGIRVIRITNVQKGKIIDDDPKFYPAELVKEIDKFLLFKNDLLVSLTGNVGRVGLLKADLLPAALNQRVGCIRLIDNKRILINYLFHVLNTDLFEENCIRASSGVAQKNLSTEWLKKYKIPLPPLEIQEEIVKELDSYQNIITGAKQIIDNWKPRIDVDPNWKKVRLDKVCEIKSGGTPATKEVSYYKNGDIPWLKSEVCKDEIVIEPKTFITEKGLKNSSTKWFTENTTLIALVGATIGKTALIKFKATTNQNIAGLYPKDLKQLNPFYLYLISQTLYDFFLRLSGGGFKMANLSFVKNLEIPLPPLEIQEEIVRKIEIERMLVESSKELIAIYEQKVREVIDKFWGS
ncbi:MAG: N-6 DNA methylase [Arcobacteraceae bacterium]